MFKSLKVCDPKISTFFVLDKISKVRWVTQKYDEDVYFLTASYEMPKNSVRLWRLEPDLYGERTDLAPTCIDQIYCPGDGISGLEFVTDDVVAISGSTGHVSLVKINLNSFTNYLDEVGRSPLLHKINADGRAAPCTGISIYGKEIATVGEDGRLNIISASDKVKVRRSIEADSCSLMAVDYVNPQEVLTANRMGVIRMFDIRTAAEANTPTASFCVSCEDEKRPNYVSCLASHPTQSHIVLAGSEEGSITVWDLRKPGFPASYLSAHSSAITELKFHRTDPSKLYTAAECGELWQWAQQTLMNTDFGETQQTDNINPWLNGERAKNRISVTSLISKLRKAINSFDSCGTKVICGSDSEAVYIIDNML